MPTSSPGHYVMVAVTDTGTGIAPEHLEKVFEPFFTTKEIGKGTGLGLSMVYGFVKQSGGHVKVYSELGHGTTVKLYLPALQRSCRRPQSKPTASANARGGNETILVVEDDARCATCHRPDREPRLRTLQAANAAEALELVESGVPIDLLFTDVVMPGGMNGRQLARRQQSCGRRYSVLFTSGYTENAIVHHGRLDAGVLLLAKPYRKPELARMIRVALSR